MEKKAIRNLSSTTILIFLIMLTLVNNAFASRIPDTHDFGLAASDDTYTTINNPSKTSGSEPLIYVSFNDWIGWLKFSLTPLMDTILGDAKLCIYDWFGSMRFQEASVYYASDNWDEETLCWNN
jgi:hypothetical protein